MGNGEEIILKNLKDNKGKRVIKGNTWSNKRHFAKQPNFRTCIKFT